MKEIGSIFPLYDKCKESGAHNNVLSGRKLFSFCREAIYLIAKKEMANGKKVMLPKYTCDTVIAPFDELGYD